MLVYHYPAPAAEKCETYYYVTNCVRGTVPSRCGLEQQCEQLLLAGGPDYKPQGLLQTLACVLHSTVFEVLASAAFTLHR
jgi:hypothetical protein